MRFVEQGRKRKIEGGKTSDIARPSVQEKGNTLSLKGEKKGCAERGKHCFEKKKGEKSVASKKREKGRIATQSQEVHPRIPGFPSSMPHARGTA